jgi:hypothetical protein
MPDTKVTQNTEPRKMPYTRKCTNTMRESVVEYVAEGTMCVAAEAYSNGRRAATSEASSVSRMESIA